MIRRVILACFLSCICGIYITKHLGSVLILAAGCAVSAVSTWVFFSGRDGKADFRLEKRYIRACFPLTERRFWYGICAAAFFLMGTAVGTEAVKMPILFDESGAAWSLEQLDGEWIRGTGRIEQITEKEGTVTLLLEQVDMASPCQGKLTRKLYVCYEEKEKAGDSEQIVGRPGQYMQFSGTFSRYSEATNPGAFDYREYCWSLGIAGQVKAAADQLQTTGKGSPVRYRLWQLRNFIRKRLLELAQPSDAGILICLLTGDKSELNDYWKELYQEGGIVHLLTISGLHISILGMGLFHLLRRTLGSFFWSSLLSGMVTAAFCIMAGSGTSMVRAMICFLLFLLAGYVGKTCDFPTAAAVSGLLILLEHPLLLFQSGFLMTFSCVMGIGFLLPLGELIFIRKDNMDENGNHLWVNLQKTLLGAVLLQLSSLPAVLWFQGTVPLLGALINIITVPFMGLVLISGLLAVVFSLVSMPSGIFLLGAAHYILCWYEQVCLFFGRLPFASRVIGRPCGWQIVLWLVILAVLLLAGYIRVLWRHKPLPFVLGIFLLPCAIWILQRYPSSDLMIRFLDVGQGDGIVLELPEGNSVFCIDGGSSSQKKLDEYVYEPYFAYAGIDQVDCWLITHPDADHYSGMLALLEQGFPVDRIFLPSQFRNSELAARIEAIHPIQYVTAGDRIRTGEIQFEILHPAADYSDLDENDASAVVYVVWKEFSALFTGDMALESEEAVLTALAGRKADVLKVAHHGSKTATSERFLREVSPETAIISSGRNNRYGHPHQEVLERLEAAGICYWNTSRNGGIQISSDGYAYRTTGTIG